MSKLKLPTDILHEHITPEFWENDTRGPIVLGTKLRGYLRRAEYLGIMDDIRRAEAQLDRLRELVPDIDERFRNYDEDLARSRGER